MSSVPYGQCRQDAKYHEAKQINYSYLFYFFFLFNLTYIMSPLGRSLFILNNWFIHLYIIPLILFRPLLTTISWNTEISSVFRSALRFWFVSRIESLSSNRTNEEVIVAINDHREVEWKIEFSPMMASDNKNPNQNVNGYTQISLTDDRISVPQRACVWCAAPRQLYRSALLMFFFYVAAYAQHLRSVSHFFSILFVQAIPFVPYLTNSGLFARWRRLG